MNKLLGALVATTILLIPTPALSIPCLPYERMEKLMEEKYVEELVAVGQTENGSQLRLYASPTSHAWTIVLIDSGGTACVMLDGTNLDTVKQEKQGPLI